MLAPMWEEAGGAREEELMLLKGEDEIQMKMQKQIQIQIEQEER